jgi:hypothetical protein
MQWKHPGTPSTKKFKVITSVGMVMLNVFWDSQRRGENVNSARTLKFYCSFGMQFAENIQANRQEEYCFIMTMPDTIPPEQPRREFKNYSGDFLNNSLTARTWPLVTSICLAR